MVLYDEAVTDLSPLKIVRSITAPLSPVQAARFRDKFGVLVLNSYGQTELGGEVVGWSAADAREWARPNSDRWDARFPVSTSASSRTR